MQSNFRFSIRRLSDGKLVLCDTEGSRVLCDNDGRILVHSNGAPKVMKTKAFQKPELKAGELYKPGLDEYLAIVEAFYSPKLNLRTQKIEIDGEVLTDAQFENLNVQLAVKEKIKVRKGDFQSSIRSSAGDHAYDPVTDYLLGIGREPEKILTDAEWEAIANTCFGLDGEFERKALQKFLIAAVARALDPGCKVDFALILCGIQGLQKSSFFEILGGKFFTGSMGNLSNLKDDLLTMQSAWICEWSEVDQVFAGAQANERVKHFLTTREDTFRAPYGRTADKQKRRQVMVGTTNRSDWATDPTGSRRFPSLNPKAINNGWARINRDRIWGRAVDEYLNQTRWWFDAEEEKEITERALANAPEDPMYEHAIAFLSARKGRWFSVKDIAMGGLEKDETWCDARNLRALASSLTRTRHDGAITERRAHYPENAAWGPRGTKNCWMLPE